MRDAAAPSGPGRFVIGLLRDWGVALVFALLAWGAWSLLFAPRLLTGGPAPEFSLPDAAGGDRIALASLGPGPIVLNFWFTSCGPCRAEIPELAKFHADNPDIPLIGVSIDQLPPGRLAALSTRLGVTWPVAHDAETSVADAYGVSLYPTTIVVAGGEIREVHQGGISAAGLEELVH